MDCLLLQAVNEPLLMCYCSFCFKNQARTAWHSLSRAVFTLTHLPETGTIKTEFGQVKIMKEFVWINRKFSGQGEKMKAKTAEQVVCLIHGELTVHI